MIGKMIGALAGREAAKHTAAIGGPTGALLGAAVPFVLSRVSLPAMVALGVGGYAWKKFTDKKDSARTVEPVNAPASNVQPLRSADEKFVVSA